MNDHPRDLLPAFVLDALDDEETRLVAQHLRVCSACRAEVASFRAAVDLLPYSAPGHTPPPHVKRQLFARIAATRNDDSSLAAPSIVVPPPRRSRWMLPALVFAVVVALLFGGMMVDAQRRLNTTTATLQHVEQQMSEQQQIVALISDTQATNLALVGQQQGAAGRVVMRSDQPYMVLVVQGLPAPPAHCVYQFWFATLQQQVPSRTFTVSANGSAELLIVVPASTNHYEQVMVTVEPDGGSAVPSNQVVLSASL